jgi:hypothetical protein
MDAFAMQNSVEWDQLIRVTWIILIPTGVLLAMVLYKLAMLLHGLMELVSLARYEMTPAMQDLRMTAEHVEALSRKAVSGVESLEEGLAATGPAIQSFKQRLTIGARSLVGSLGQVFLKS